MVHGLHSYFHSKQKRLRKLVFIWNADIAVKALTLKLIVQLKSNDTLFPLQGAFGAVFCGFRNLSTLSSAHFHFESCQVNLFTILNCHMKPGRLANEVLGQPPLGLPPKRPASSGTPPKRGLTLAPELQALMVPRGVSPRSICLFFLFGIPAVLSVRYIEIRVWSVNNINSWSPFLWRVEPVKVGALIYYPKPENISLVNEHWEYIWPQVLTKFGIKP